jgi:hypothetical protein
LFFQLLYNESLCYAIPGSNAMALAYGNRSAAYFEVQEYDKCLENIKAALINKFPQQKVSKLIERKEMCKKILASSGDDDHSGSPNEVAHFEFKLTRPANPKIPFIADCLKLKYNKKFGNHITTNKALVPGDIVAIDELFYHTITMNRPNAMYTAFAFFPHFFETHFSFCAHCLKSNLLSLAPCEGCIHTMYCSEECRSNAKSYHELECETFDHLPNHLAVRSFFQALSYCNNDIEALKVLITTHEESGGPPLTVFDLDFTQMGEREIKEISILAAYNGDVSQSEPQMTQSDLETIEYLLKRNSETSEMMEAHGDFIISFIQKMKQKEMQHGRFFTRPAVKLYCDYVYAGKK